MPSVTVDQFLFDLPTGWTWLKYDECTYYRSHFNDLASSKAVDLLALAPQRAELLPCGQVVFGSRFCWNKLGHHQGCFRR